MDAALEDSGVQQRFKTSSRICGVSLYIVITVLWIQKPWQHLTVMQIGWGKGIAANEAMFHVVADAAYTHSD